MKKIYFACSIRGGRDDAESYAELVKHIQTKAVVLTEIFANQKLTAEGMNKPNAEIWKIDTDWIHESDAIIAEVTNPSLGVGYEIALAETLGKPVLALFRDTGERKLSAMIDGSPHVTVCNYKTLDAAYEGITVFIQNLEK